MKVLFKDKFPDIFAQAKPELNLNPKIPLDEITTGSGCILTFECGEHHPCPKKHTWDAQVSNRTKPHRATGCPYCANPPKLICEICTPEKLLFSRPDLMSQFDRDAHAGVDPKHLTLNSHDKYWWICSEHTTCKQHRWPATIKSRAEGYGCPYCCQGAKKICECASHKLLSSRGDLVSEIDVKKNADENVDTNLALGSTKRIHWKCATGHMWMAQVNARAGKGTGCPHCVHESQKSAMERACESVLKDMGISPITEKRFVDCRYKLELKWDFFIPGMGHRGVLIETDGDQHFNPWDGRYNESFDDVRKRDGIKNNYAKTNHHLLRISWAARHLVHDEVHKFLKDVATMTPTSPPIFRLIGPEYKTDQYKQFSL